MCKASELRRIGSIRELILGPVQFLVGVRRGQGFDVVERIESEYWGTPGSRGAFSPTPTAPGKRTYHIPAHRVAEQSGYTLTLYYEVLQRDGEWAPSDPHTLKVEAVSNMPTPSCDQVNGGQLSIKRLADGTAKVSAQAWPFVTIGQEVKLELYGLQRGSGGTCAGQSVPQRLPATAAKYRSALSPKPISSISP
ncbi:hypothetical protein [Pseudomonas laurentiana]